MKVFISWPGDKSKTIAETLRDWLPTIVQSAQPFISTQDISAGSRGLQAVASELEACSFGILCLTRENKQAPWILFEAGALSKAIDSSRVIPLLLDFKISDLTGPLAQFQAIDASDKEKVFSMVMNIAHSDLSVSVAEDRLRKVFDALWPELESKITDLRNIAEPVGDADHRSDRDIMEELLSLARSADRQIALIGVNSVVSPFYTVPLDPSIATSPAVNSTRTITVNQLKNAHSAVQREKAFKVLTGKTVGNLEGRAWMDPLDDGISIVITPTENEFEPGELDRFREAVRDVANTFKVPITIETPSTIEQLSPEL
jgi:hypothetical protein